MAQYAPQGVSTGFGITASAVSYDMTKASVAEQKERNQLALTDRIGARNQALSNEIAAMKSGQAARGVSGAEGIYAGAEKSAKQDIRAMEINTAQTMRELELQKSTAAYDKKMTGLGGLFSSAASGAAGYYAGQVG